MPREYKISVIPGDGVGPEVVAEGIKVLKALSEVHDLSFVFMKHDIGKEKYLKDGTLLPDTIIDELREADAIYLGAIGHPDVTPGVLERGIMLKLRFTLDLYINLRPVLLLPGVETPLRNKGPEDIDLVIIRENTEGLYAGSGGFFKKGTSDEIALQESINTRRGVERCIQYAFDYCRRRNRKRHLTLCGKNNILTYESNLWDRVFEEVKKEYPDISSDYQYVDALCMWLIKNPEKFDVIVTNNMFGDIITDIGAVIQGGLGIAASANINPEGTAMFEPVGGSAPKYSSSNKINPLAAISAAKMMLDYLEEEEVSETLLEAIKKVIKNDLRSMEAGKMGYSTTQVGDLVTKYIRG
jgi:3-isopropylmalate dehydrogenase